jgi:hypothetical protein
VSSPLAIAAVTAVLRDLLNDGLINNDLSQVGSFTVSALPPDRITTGPTEDNRLNLFLYRVSPNIGWRNAGQPAISARGQRLTNPPLALDLHYLMTAYGQADFAAEILLGYAMELLHNNGIIARETIRRSLSPTNPISVALIPPDPEGRQAIDLADQLEALKVSPAYLSAEDLSRMWTSMQARYRPSAAYQVSTVLIQSTRPVRASMPVLRRGPNDRGVISAANLLAPPPAWPTLTAVTVSTLDGGARGAAELGDAVVLSGAQLTGAVPPGGPPPAVTVTAVFEHPLLTNPKEIPVAGADLSDTAAKVTLPAVDTKAAPATWPDWPAGNYAVSLRISVAGKPDRVTNALAVALAPRIYAAPTVAGAGAGVTVTLQVFPQLWPGQRIDVCIGAEPFRLADLAQKAATITAPVGQATRADTAVPVRLRVDGIDSQFVRDSAATPPQFDPNQSVTIPA